MEKDFDDTPIVFMTSKIKEVSIEHTKYNFTIWRPKLNSLIPPNKPKKYFVFSLFHFFTIFKNNSYCGLLVYDKASPDKVISSLLVVPKFFKWRFMDNDDVQFIYVMTDSNYRGKGIANMMMFYISKQEEFKHRKIWYVTNVWNIASQKSAVKSGFEFIGKAKRIKGFLGQKILELI